MSLNTHVRKAHHLLELGRHSEAAAEYSRALASDPHDVYALSGLAICEHALGQTKTAYDRIKQTIGENPDDPYPRFVYAQFLLEDDKDRQATKVARELIEMDPEDADYWAVLSQGLAGTSEWAKSLRAAENGLALDPSHAQCLHLRAHCLSILGQRGAAEEASLEVLAQDAESSYAHSTRGWSQLRAGKVREASQSFAEALRLDAENDSARTGLKEAVRGLFPPYRWLQAFGYFQQRLGKYSWVLIIGVIAVRGSLRTFVETNPPPMQKGLAIGAAALLFFLIWGWPILNPLMNVVLRLHPIGRHILTGPEQIQVRYVSGLLALAAVTVIASLVVGRGWPALLASLIGIAALGLSGMVTSSDRLRNTLAHVVGSVFLVLGVVLLGSIVF